MLDEVKEFAARYFPPAGLGVGLSAMILFMHNQTEYTWPLLGKFVMDDGLKAILIALVWFLCLTGWAALKAVTPRLRYSIEIVDATKEAREILNTIQVSMLEFNHTEDSSKKVALLLNVIRNNARVGANLQSEKASEVFFNACKFATGGDEASFNENTKKFRKMTKWIRWR